MYSFISSTHQRNDANHNVSFIGGKDMLTNKYFVNTVTVSEDSNMKTIAMQMFLPCGLTLKRFEFLFMRFLLL